MSEYYKLFNEHDANTHEETPKHTPAHTVPYFDPDRIILAKDSLGTPECKAVVKRVCELYPYADIEKCLDTPHNKIVVEPENNAIKRHTNGKRTLVLGVMRSPVRLSTESGNTCPNFWHYSVNGFCPYGCSYCYLAGTPGVWYSPSVKIYVNFSDIIDAINCQVRVFNRPTAFYHGKLQDGLALDPITGYMQSLIPYFARQQYARHIILTKSAFVDSVLPLDHGGHTVLSWSLNPPSVASVVETNTPPVEARIQAMRKCAEAGYPVRVVLMPIVPVPGWESVYGEFIEQLLTDVPLSRLTIGGICSYNHAQMLMTHHIGTDNTISAFMSDRKSPGDGRRRYDPRLRISMYRFIVGKARSMRPDLQIGLCMEEPHVWRSVGFGLTQGICNCVW